MMKNASAMWCIQRVRFPNLVWMLVGPGGRALEYFNVFPLRVIYKKLEFVFEAT
jgi:hypothetical protein